MAKRLHDTEIWRGSWFRKLSPKGKLLWLYLCDICNCAGIVAIDDLEQASFFIGIPVFPKDIEELSKQYKKIDHKRILLLDFINFQYGFLSPSHKMYKNIHNELAKFDLKYPIDTVSIQLKEKEKEKELSFMKGGEGGKHSEEEQAGNLAPDDGGDLNASKSLEVDPLPRTKAPQEIEETAQAPQGQEKKFDPIVKFKSGTVLTVGFYYQLIRKYDRHQVHLWIFRARNANNPAAYILEGIKKGYITSATEEENANPAAVRDWIEEHIEKYKRKKKTFEGKGEPVEIGGVLKECLDNVGT